MILLKLTLLVIICMNLSISFVNTSNAFTENSTLAEETTMFPLSDTSDSTAVAAVDLQVLANHMFANGHNDEYHEVGNPCFTKYFFLLPTDPGLQTEFWDFIVCVCFLNCKRGFLREMTPEQETMRRRLSVDIAEESRETRLQEYLPEIITFSCIYSFEIVFGTLANLLVLVAIFRNMGKVSATNLFIASVSCGDMLVAAICAPFQLYTMTILKWELGMEVCQVTVYLYYFSYSVSVLSMVLLSIERYVVICYPMKAHNISRLSTARRHVSAIWIMSAVIALPSVFTVVSMVFTVDSFAAVCQHAKGLRPGYITFLGLYFLFLFVIPTLIMGVCYCRIAVTLYRSVRTNKSLQASAGKDGKEAEDTTGRIQVIRMLIGVWIMFVVCWLPQWVVYIAESEQAIHGLNGYQVNTLLRCTRCLTFFGSVVNPFLYALSSAQYRRAFIRTMCCCSRSLVNRYREPTSASMSGTRSTAFTKADTKMDDLPATNGNGTAVTNCNDTSVDPVKA